MKLIKLGFTKLAIEDKNVPTKTVIPKVKMKLPSNDDLKTFTGKEHFEKHLKLNNPKSPKIHPITATVLKGISKDVQTYASGDKEVWNKKFKKFEKSLKDPKKVVGATLGAGLYFAGKKHPKLENALNIIKDRQINFINQPKQKLSLTVPKKKSGNWNLSWSKAF